MGESSASIGERVALHRRRRGLSQAQVARLLGRSEHWLSQVERGVRSVDRASVLIQLSGVLRVPVADLAPGVLVTEEHEGEPPVVAAARRAMTAYPTLAQPVGGRPLEPAELPELRTELEQAWTLVHAARQEELAGLLPGLLERADAARSRLTPHEGADRFRLASEAYQIAAALLTQLGETDLAWAAADRALVSAEIAGDRLLVAASAFRLAHAFLGGDQPAQAQTVADAAAATLETRLANASPALVALWGALNLVGACAATQQQDRDGALQRLERAEEAARRVGSGRTDGHTEFGPENVDLHAVGIAVDLGNPSGALGRASEIDVSGLSPERRARFLIDVARAWGQRRMIREALGALAEAEALSPELVRTLAAVRELLRELLAHNAPEARSYARALGMLVAP
jgi:transcriptional regulator with XRE-family HTH domain